MQISPAYASKLVRQKSDQIRVLLAEERETSTTTACVGEDVSEMRNQYDFEDMQDKIEALNRDILKLKHSINQFNVTTVLPGTDYTVDAALVRMKMLSDMKARLANMKQMQPVVRHSGGFGNKQPEYTYRNFEAADVSQAYTNVETELTNIQLALDKVNLESVLTVDIES